VTGAYHPEISAAGVQCRAAAAALGDRVRFSVLATAVDRALPEVEIVDGVMVYRVPVDVRDRTSKMRATLRLASRLAKTGRAADVIHVHGFSQKNVPVAMMAKLAGTPVVLTLHTAGQDEPDVVRARGRLAYWAFRSADLVLSVSPSLSDRYLGAGLPAARLRLVPNGIDTNRFRPADAAERRALRRELGWPETAPIVLFVGFFSRDKRPDLLFRVWRNLAATAGSGAMLVYVGATAQPYYEIDDSLSREIRNGAEAIGRGSQVRFVSPTNEVEKHFRAADVFVLPSAREAHPLALLEAMASGLTCLATRLPGATNVIIDDGVNGRLFPVDDEAALARALHDALTDRPHAAAMGVRARETVETRYDIRQTAERWRAAYAEVLA
jgi:glycosyltransferase involved in cell wall biosynthesis